MNYSFLEKLGQNRCRVYDGIKQIALRFAVELLRHALVPSNIFFITRENDVISGSVDRVTW